MHEQQKAQAISFYQSDYSVVNQQKLKTQMGKYGFTNSALRIQ